MICVRIKDILTRENKNWPKRRIAIEGEMIVIFHLENIFLCVTHHLFLIQYYKFCPL